MKSLIQGFLTGVREQARALAPRLVTSPRFSRRLNTSREISLLWEGIHRHGASSPSDTVIPHIRSFPDTLGSSPARRLPPAPGDRRSELCLPSWSRALQPG